MSVQPPPPSQLRASKATAQRSSSHRRLSFENRSHRRRSHLLPPSCSHFPPMAALFHTTTSATFPESRIIRASCTPISPFGRKSKRTLALGSLPPPSPGSRRLHFFFFSLFGTQVAWFVIPIFPVFSVRGLEQLAVGSPLAVALPIVVVSSVSIRVSVEVLASTFK
ncbi:uncharacterized protein LOC130954548 isoform X2 [Arachis stenosperma]|uniref:uncharacterized protein LOC130954548 isoform X2 n=1 Tax=Arachis stenosperma TaxID=217475 RepID=UPI0025AD71C7|nr:uncharacterized protein LOC130954548 isoform X2 [Arachis stenosperma]